MRRNHFSHHKLICQKLLIHLSPMSVKDVFFVVVILATLLQTSHSHDFHFNRILIFSKDMLYCSNIFITAKFFFSFKLTQRCDKNFNVWKIDFQIFLVLNFLVYYPKLIPNASCSECAMKISFHWLIHNLLV